MPKLKVTTLKLQSIDQLASDWFPFLWCQSAELMHEFHHGHRLDLLQVKRAFPEERFGAYMLPRIAAQCCRVRKNRHHRQFVVAGIISQQQAGADLPRQAEVHQPNLTAIWARHPLSPF